MDGYITKQQAYDMLRYLDDEYSFIPEVIHDKILSLWYNEINNLLFPAEDLHLKELSVSEASRWRAVHHRI